MFLRRFWMPVINNSEVVVTQGEYRDLLIEWFGKSYHIDTIDN